MPTYKGNAGHLMQHWTLCDWYKHADGLNYIDAHAMAPLATERQVWAKMAAESRLPNLGDSAVAWRAWHQAHVCPRKGYPNSAAFVEQVWKGDFSMLLCEIDRRPAKR